MNTKSVSVYEKSGKVVGKDKTLKAGWIIEVEVETKLARLLSPEDREIILWPNGDDKKILPDFVFPIRDGKGLLSSNFCDFMDFLTSTHGLGFEFETVCNDQTEYEIFLLVDKCF